MGFGKKVFFGKSDTNKKLTISTLKQAVQYNQIEHIRNSLHRYGLPKNGKVMTDYSILQLAILDKKTEIAKLLIDAGCRVNANSTDVGSTPLASAVQYENEEIATLLLKKGANWDAKFRGITVLHHAAQYRSIKMLNFLLRYEISIDHISCGKTPFQTFLEHCYDINADKSIAIVRMFLAKGASINFKTNDGQTVLHHIIKCKWMDIITNVLQATNDVNEQSNNKNTPLHNLLIDSKNTEENIVEVVKLVISKGAKVDINNNSGDTVCHLAAKNKYLQILQIFLQCQWDVNGINQLNNTVLHYLLKDSADLTKNLQHFQIVNHILNQNSFKLIKNKEGKTPVHIAAENKQSQILNNMLSKPMDINTTDIHGNTVLYIFMRNLIDKKIAPNKDDIEIVKKIISLGANTVVNSWSIFHYCANNLQLDILHAIVSLCKNIDICDCNENTVIHALLTHNMNTSEEVEKKVTDIVLILLSKGVEVTAVNDKGEVPLHLAARAKHFETTKALLQKGANVAELDNHGNSVLHFLCMLQSKIDDSVEERLFELFVGKGCDINARNKSGMTPILLAAEFGLVNMTRILLKLGVKTDCVENENLSMPIHLAAQKNHQDIVEQLLQYGVDVNARRRDRKTPLHLAVTHTSPKVTRLLLEGGADTDLKDNAGKTPLHWACWHESLDNINELLDYGADVNAEDNFHVIPLKLIPPSNDSYKRLRYHIIKLKAAGIRVSKRNGRAIEKSSREYENSVATRELREFETLAIEETLKMEQVSIAPRTSLADVLLMSPNKLSVFKSNEAFQQLLYSDDFKDKFPIYADLVRACYRKGIIRSDLMISAKDALRKMLRLALPDTCCDVIFHYLDNENLHNLDKAAQIRITKRKRFVDEFDEVVPGKRVRRISV